MVRLAVCPGNGVARFLRGKEFKIIDYFLAAGGIFRRVLECLSGKPAGVAVLIIELLGVARRAKIALNKVHAIFQFQISYRSQAFSACSPGNKSDAGLRSSSLCR